MHMIGKNWTIGIFGLLAILMLGSITFPGATGTQDESLGARQDEIWQFTFTENDADVEELTYGDEWYSGTFSIDTAKSPKEIDLTITDSSEGAGTSTALGIYKIEGSTLTLASAPPDETTRPTDFTPDGYYRVWILTKTTRATELEGIWIGYEDFGGNGGNGDDYYPGWSVEDGGIDPSTETPTDTSISVSITEGVYSWTDSTDPMKAIINVHIKGTTSGVSHCLLMPVAVASDGTEEDSYYWEIPMDWEDDAAQKSAMEAQGFSAFWFKSTSNGDWKTWEYKVTGEVDKADMGYLDPETAGKVPVKFKIYVRAFSDETEADWNQAMKEVEFKINDDGTGDSTGDGTGDTDGSKKKDDDDGGFLPGFEAVVMLAALSLALIAASTTRYRK